jgi:hypothetical protein
MANHVKKHGMSNTSTYRSWHMMLQRCYNKNNPSFIYYGERGITVDEKWRSFENFYKDMGDRPEGTSIDRIDVNGNYCKNNCKWSSLYEQAKNKRKFKNCNSNVTGVHFYEKHNKWIAYITRNKKRKHLGYFLNFDDAVKARKIAEINC